VPERNPAQPTSKRSYRTNEVCQLTDTQPYVLRFWESEFPQLSPQRRGGQAVYTSQDVDVVMRIKRLLYDEEYTIEGARKRLEQELAGDIDALASSSEVEIEDPPEVSLEPPRGPAIEIDDDGDADEPVAPRAASLAAEPISRERYEDAIEEISHLRQKLREAETAAKKNDVRAQKAEEGLEQYRTKARESRLRLAQLLERLGPQG